jgi:hypothetical protein
MLGIDFANAFPRNRQPEGTERRLEVFGEIGEDAPVSAISLATGECAILNSLWGCIEQENFSAPNYDMNALHSRVTCAIVETW